MLCGSGFAVLIEPFVCDVSNYVAFVIVNSVFR